MTEYGKLYAYNIDGTRDSTRDFDTLFGAPGSRASFGIWSDGTTMWMVDAGNDKIFAYRMTDKTHDSSKDFNSLIYAGNNRPTGIWSDGTTMWVADWVEDKIFAYRMSDKGRDTGKEFNTLDASVNRPTGIWSDGTTMWVANEADDKIYAYRMTDKVRDSGKDFNTLIAAGNEAPRDIWSDGATMWVTDWIDSKVYSYNMPPSDPTVGDGDPAVTISFEQAAYAVAEGGSVTVSVTLSADPERTVEIPIITTDQGGATAADYSGVPASVTFARGDTSQTFSFTATDDAEDDDGESVRLAFGTLPNGVTVGSPATATIILLNEDSTEQVVITTEPDGLADYDNLCSDTRATLTVGVAFSGTLGTPMDIDAIKVALTAGTMGYKVVLLDHNDLEMSAERHTFGMVHPDGMYVSYHYLTNWVNERDNLIIIPEETGTYCVEIRDRFRDGRYMQDYQILVSELDPLANPEDRPGVGLTGRRRGRGHTDQPGPLPPY